MRTRSHVMFALALAALAPAVPANAITLLVGPNAGWSYTSDSEISAPIFGGAARVHLLDFISAELAVSYRSEDVEGGGTIDTVPIQVSGMLHIVPAVHATLGVGWYEVDANLDAVGMTLGSFDDQASDFGLHLGGGVDVPLSTRLLLNLEARYVFLGYDLSDATNLLDVKADYLQLSAGILLQLF